MMISRRFMAVSGTALLAAALLRRGMPVQAGVAQPPGPSPTSVRMRLETFSQDAGRVAALRRGVAAMKARKPSDPTSWFYQAAIHGVAAEAVAEARRLDPAVAGVDQARFWNQCPHFDALGASSLNFLVWHRAYLHHFELILRAASGDHSLALPYWNYGDPAQRRIPGIFAEPVAGNPLYSPERTQEMKAGAALAADAVDRSSAFRQVSFVGPSAARGFGGALLDLEPTQEGAIEQSPHNGVHGALGGSFTKPDGSEGDGLMGAVETAAFDPVFWVHHCEIDRLWTLWECRGRFWGSDPAKPPFSAWLAAKPWWFHGEGGETVNLPRAAYVRRDRLGIRYDADDPSCRPLSATLPEPVRETVAAGGAPSVGGPMAMHRSMDGMAPDRLRLGGTQGPIALADEAPTERRISIEAPRRAARSSPANEAARVPDRRRTLVEVVGLAAERRRPVAYDVYVDLPAGTAPTRDLPNYLGSVDFFRTSAPAGGRVAAFDVTDFLAAKGVEARDLKVTLVPVRLVAPATSSKALAAPRPRAPVTVEAIRVVSAPAP